MAMELYTLTPGFVRDVVIDEFESVIWTERYTQAGDVTLVLPATRDRVKQLAPGLFLALKGSNEVMNIETQVIEDNMMTITGSTLEKFLDNRRVQVYKPIVLPGGNGQPIYILDTKWDLKDTPEKMMAQIVQEMLISSNHITHSNQIGNTMQNLALGPIYRGALVGNFATQYSVTLNSGDPLYTALLNIAEAHHLGMSLYLEYANETTYQLRFSVYHGVDHATTALNPPYPLVRFSPELDSFTNIKELRSVDGYKNCVVVNIPVPWSPFDDVTVFAYEIDGLPIAPSFGLRTAYIKSKRVTDKMFKKAMGPYTGNQSPAPTEVDPIDYFLGNYNLIDNTERDRILDIMKEEGRAYLTENKRKRVIDGETVPQDYYQFGSNYKLGDLVQVENYTNTLELVRITEYIKTQDITGQRAYPTLVPLTINGSGYLHSDESNLE